MLKSTAPADATRADARNRAPLRVAFVVGKFPVTSEVFIIDQACDLIDRGIDVQIFAFERGDGEHISPRYASHGLRERTHYLRPPVSRLPRMVATLVQLGRLLLRRPDVLTRIWDPSCHGGVSLSVRTHAVAPFVGRTFDLVHCHFADIALRYLPIRALLRAPTPMVTTFYGYDASMDFQHRASDDYAQLRTECALFYVMSENMRQRVLAHGFPAEKISVLPAAIAVEQYPFTERTCPADEPVQILAVGRLVEKKGFADLLTALALVRRKTTRPFICSIVGSGPLEAHLRQQCRELGLDEAVRFLGSMSVDRLIALMATMHFLVAPSKTAVNGDME